LINNFTTKIFYRDKDNKKPPPLRKLLTQEEITNVDALLRRINAILQVDGLTPDEKESVVKGKLALSKLFYVNQESKK